MMLLRRLLVARLWTMLQVDLRERAEYLKNNIHNIKDDAHPQDGQHGIVAS